MPKQLNVDKILKQLDGVEIDEVKRAYREIKEYVTKRLTEYQKKLQDESSDIQSVIERL